MQLGYCEFDTTVDEHHRKLAEIVDSKKTLIFFDTNILAYLYKLHSNARNEFYMWADSAIHEERLFLPGWAANEYSNRVTTNKLGDYTYKGNDSSPDKAKKMYDILHEMASLSVDDDILAKNEFNDGRERFLDEFRTAINSLSKYTKVLKTQFKVEDVHNEITNHFSKIILNSNLAQLCMKANREGDTRFKHRLPPGFKDSAKGENRFGDLIIWYEILENSKKLRKNFNHVLFLSNDEKSDWVYAPKSKAIVNSNNNRRLVPNNDPIIKVVDPRLVAEFNNVVGHSNFTICNLASLIESLSKIRPQHFTNLAGAIQINIQEFENSTTGKIKPLEKDAESKEGHTELSENSTESIDENTESVEEGSNSAEDNNNPIIRYTQEALQDVSYQADTSSVINSIIHALKSHNWYKQNPAISMISKLADEHLDPSSSFVLGRNIYQAACGNSQKATEYMTSLSKKLDIFPIETANHILAGMAFEIYFDSNAQYREKFKFSYASNILRLLTNENFKPARDFIRNKLLEQENDLLFMPGESGEPKKEITINVGISEENNSSFILNSVLFNDKELIIDIESTDNFWHESIYTASKIKAEISTTLAIPQWALTLISNLDVGDKLLILPEEKRLSPLAVNG